MEAEVGRVIAGRYRVDRLIGSGGMGSVFAGFDLRLERPVAVKIIHGHVLGREEARLRFLREAKVAARVQSPHVVAVYDVGVEGEEVYLVQELLSGPSLDSILAAEGPLAPRRVVSLAVQICKALVAIHGAGAIHRDIKPSNLLLAAFEDGGERVVLVDFGIAKILAEQESTAITSPGVVIGTPAYMAPEQARSGGDVNGKTDLYALGLTLFELLTNTRPFQAEHFMATLAKVLFEDRALLTFPGASGSPELQAVIRRCLSVEPNDRHASAAFLMEALLATPEGRAGYVAPKASEPAEPAALPPLSGPVSTAFDRAISPPKPPKPPKPSKPPSELTQYLDQAGLVLLEGPGPLLAIDRQPSCRLPPLHLWAILLEPADQPLTTQTMATLAFQQGARPLYALSGTAEAPHHVLALFRSPPGAGVYREWHDLAARRHVYVLPVAPSALRAAVEVNRAGAHLQELLRRARRDPFELEGRIDTDLDFFGGRDDLHAFLHQIDRASAGIAFFGLEKWGTTSLLIRARAELGDRFSTWVDLAALPSLSLASVLSAVYEDLTREFIKRGHTAPLSQLSPHEDVETPLLHVLEACHTRGGVRPVIFLDRVDELSNRERCPPETLVAIARALYRLAFPRSGRPGGVLVFGGRDDHLLSSRTLGAHDNPLWGALAVRYASFFSREEMGEFMQRLGALGGLSFSSFAIDKAFALTFGHKYLSRRLGSMLYQRASAGAEGSGEVTQAMVSACAATLVTRHHPYFDAILRRGPPALRDVLARLAEGPAALDELLSHEATQAAGDPLAALDFAFAYRLAVEEEGRYRLTMGLFEAWLRWTRASSPRPERATPPPARPDPGPREIQELEALIREGFSAPGDLELLARKMQIALATVVRLSMPLPNQIGDLVDWAVKHRRFGDLREAVRAERPNFFPGGAGQSGPQA